MNTLNHQRMKSRLLQAGGYMLMSAIIVACVSKAGDMNGHDQSETTTKAIVAGTPVDGLVIKPGVISDRLEVTGTLVANQEVDIVSELTRKLVRVNVKEGSHVKQGTLLFQLDDADLQAQLQRYHQQEKLAKLNEERLKDLIEHDAIAQQDYDEASTNLKVLQAQIQEVEVAISKTRITAPFDGQIGMINVHQGAIVSVSTLLTNIEDNTVVKVEFSIPEKYTNVIQLGSSQNFVVAGGQKQYTAKVVAKGASLNQDTRTLLVRAVASNPQGQLLPGQSARLSLALNTSGDALAVTSQALIPSSSGYTVFVAHNNIVELVPVEIGQRSEGAVEITKGLNKGDTVITSNLLRLMPGSPVHFVTLK